MLLTQKFWHFYLSKQYFIILVGGAGLLMILAFPPFNYWPLALIGLVPIMIFALQFSPRRAFLAGWIFGFILNLGIFYWLIVVMISYGDIHWLLALIILILMQIYLALYSAIFAYGIAWLRIQGISIHLTSPLLWASLEWIRGQAFTGFPWLPLSGALTSFPPLVQSVELWGATGLSAVIVLINSLICQILLPNALGKGQSWQRWVAGLMTLILLIGGWRWGLLRMDIINQASAAAPHLAVSIVQANVSLAELWNYADKNKVIHRHLSLTGEIARVQNKRPWLVIWPESAAPFYFLRESRESEPVLTAARELDAFIILGSLGAVGEPPSCQITNRTWLVGPEGLPLGFYDKIHLVPFGEYVPIAKVLFFVRGMATLSQDFSSGLIGHTLAVDSFNLGPIICYESIFPELARAQRQRGSLLIINQTNDAWFGYTNAPAQHMSHLILRSVENRVACARSANTGISAFILPDGRVEQVTALFVSTWISRELPLLAWDTLFTKNGDLVGPLSLGITLLLGIWAVFFRRSSEEIVICLRN